jgi:ADP-ribosylation factor GTPase-activating protein 1
LGVHISFVRSIAMDSWSDKQMALMKGGGNAACNNYLKERGIDARTPIREKYDNDHAQLYKEVLKARIAGLPEPTVLPPKAPKSGNNNRPASGGAPTGISGGGGTDPNGMERLAGENDQQYIARQTRLTQEAKARMASKFGGGGAKKMGGVGSGGSMQGIGSNPNYNPNGGGAGYDMDSVTSAFGSAFSSVGSIVGNVSSIVRDEQTKAAVSNSVGGFWNSLSSSVSNVASSIAAPDGGDDGLADLQRQFHSNRPQQSKYGGFGSDQKSGSGGSSNNWNTSSTPTVGGAAPMGGSNVGEAPGLPTEDRNGIERLTGENDEQYVARQTRLRDEAKARMAAKFGGGGLSSAGSASYQPSPSSGSSSAPPSSGNFGGVAKAPVSGNSSRGSNTPSRKNSKDSFSGDDFFSSFGN